MKSSALLTMLIWPLACKAGEHSAPSKPALRAALQAFSAQKRRLSKHRYLTLIDYDLPMTSKRLWVLDRQDNNTVVVHSRVSHAWRSGLLYAKRFSNRPGSNLSSIGSYVTLGTYRGRFGHSLRVRGLEARRNGNAYRRAIVFHPDLGMTHSLGCFMLPAKAVHPVLDRIRGGSLVYVHRSKPEGSAIKAKLQSGRHAPGASASRQDHAPRHADSRRRRLSQRLHTGPNEATTVPAQHL